jgi:integrin beta 8
VFFEGNGYGLSQDLGSAGSCLEDFQLMPFMQCSSSDVCRHGVRTDKSFWLAVNKDAPLKPMNDEDTIKPYISRCAVCIGTSYVLARHSFTSTAPDCPDDFSAMWTGYSYVMVTSSGTSGGGQDLSSAGSCLENFFLPTFIECLGRGTCSYYINNLDYWLAQKQPVIPGMWGMGNVYNGMDVIMNNGVARCTVCARNTNQ